MNPNKQNTALAKQAPNGLGCEASVIKQVYAMSDVNVKAENNSIHELKQRLLQQAREHNVPIHGETDVTYGSMGGRLVLRLWQDGYTVGFSDLKHYHVPENMLVLNSLTKGQIPSSVKERHSGGVEIEEYEIMYNQPRRERFYGSRHRPAITGGQLVQQGPLRPQFVVMVDDNVPKTTLKIRFIGGYSTVQEFNHTHRVGDIRSYVASISPIQNFKLTTESTARDLTNDGQTLLEAGLLSASIIQKIRHPPS